MRNPFSNSNAKSWMERTLLRCRDAFRGIRSSAGVRKSLQAWVIGVLLCVSLAGCISLMEMARRSSSKDEGKATIAKASATTTATAANLKPSAAEPEQKPAKEVSAGTHKKAVQGANSGKPVAKEEKGSLLATIQIKPTISGPPVDSLEKEEGEKEDSQISRKRQSGFFDQRAYPNKHIPAGAYQKALEQRDAI